MCSVSEKIFKCVLAGVYPKVKAEIMASNNSTLDSYTHAAMHFRTLSITTVKLISNKLFIAILLSQAFVSHLQFYHQKLELLCRDKHHWQ